MRRKRGGANAPSRSFTSADIDNTKVVLVKLYHLTSNLFENMQSYDHGKYESRNVVLNFLQAAC